MEPKPVNRNRMEPEWTGTEWNRNRMEPKPEPNRNRMEPELNRNRMNRNRFGTGTDGATYHLPWHDLPRPAKTYILQDAAFGTFIPFLTGDRSRPTPVRVAIKSYNDILAGLHHSNHVI